MQFKLFCGTSHILRIILIHKYDILQVDSMGKAYKNAPITGAWNTHLQQTVQGNTNRHKAIHGN